MNKQDALIDQNDRDNEAIFNKQYYQDITKRTDFVNLMRQYEEQMSKEHKRNEAIATITGATDDAKQRATDATNKAYADMIANYASNAARLKDGYLTNWQNQRNNYYQQKLGMSEKFRQDYLNQSEQWGKVASGLFDTAGQFGSMALKGLSGMGGDSIPSLSAAAGSNATAVSADGISYNPDSHAAIGNYINSSDILKPKI